jgi:DNA repair protein RecO (recombination protein O)
MLKRTEGIVLRTFPFGEADLIVTYLTPDFGLIKLFAKSPRKIKSRFGGSLEPLTLARISFWGKEDTPLPRLTQSDILCSFRSIRDNLRVFLRACEIIELTLSFIPERDGNKRVYALLLDTLQTVEHNPSPPVNSQKSRENSTPEGKGSSLREDMIFNHYKIKFLRYVGFAPKLDTCGRCGKKGYCFYISQGSILCEACVKGSQSTCDMIGSPIRLSPAVLKFYDDLLMWDTAKIQRIKPSPVLLAELSAVLGRHIKYILSKPLKSEAFLCSGVAGE